MFIIRPSPDTSIPEKTHQAYGTMTKRVFFSGSLSECAKWLKNRNRRQARKMRDEALRGIGLAKVRGPMGGIYWE